jgi:hypothetical protein
MSGFISEPCIPFHCYTLLCQVHTVLIARVLIYVEIRNCDLSSFVLSQYHFSYCEFLWFHMNITIVLPISIKKASLYPSIWVKYKL